MAILLRDSELDGLVRELARELNTTLQGAVETAVRAELRRLRGATVRDRLRPLRERLRSLPARETAPDDHKAFFDREYRGL